MMKKVLGLLVLVSASALLVGCGGGGSSASTTKGGTATNGGSVLRLIADPTGRPAFTTTDATVQAGKVELELENGSPVPHDLAIEASNGKLVGKTAVVTKNMAYATVDLKPGTYTFYCSVPGHREAGMEGTLKVT